MLLLEGGCPDRLPCQAAAAGCRQAAPSTACLTFSFASSASATRCSIATRSSVLITCSCREAERARTAMSRALLLVPADCGTGEAVKGSAASAAVCGAVSNPNSAAIGSAGAALLCRCAGECECAAMRGSPDIAAAARMKSGATAGAVLPCKRPALSLAARGALWAELLCDACGCERQKELCLARAFVLLKFHRWAPLQRLRIRRKALAGPRHPPLAPVTPIPAKPAPTRGSH